jgi:penicillin V acylase-like amidase (Ntn superfamily)
MEPDFIQYAHVTEANVAQVLSPMQFLTWILTSFSSVEEVKQHAHEVVVRAPNQALLGWGQGA